MKYTVAFVLATISMVQGSIIGGPAALVGPSSLGAALRGPSSGATIVGPDGSVISSASDSGALLAAPALRSAIAPGVLVGGAQQLISSPSLLSSRLVVGGAGTVISGPSGIISTNGNPLGAIGVGIPSAIGVGPLGEVRSLGLGLGNGIW